LFFAVALVRLNFVHLKLLEKNIGFLALVEEAVVK
jgi:hypothetical protein